MSHVDRRQSGRVAPLHPYTLVSALAKAMGCMSAAMALAAPAAAQDLSKPNEAEAMAPASGLPATAADELGFTANQLLYDQERDVVTAQGNVVATRDGKILRADSVTWSRASNKVVAKGDVSVTDPSGDVAYGDTVEVSDTLKDGIVTSLLLVTKEGDRIAAETGRRQGAIYILNSAAYSPCAVIDEHGCPKEPTWQIKAANVVYDSERELVRYDGARLELFGLPLIPLPGLTHHVGGKSGNGLLVPDFNFLNGGLDIAVPYYFALQPNRDLVLKPHFISNALPMIEARYRALVDKGAYQVAGYLTRGRVTDPATGITDPSQSMRGYIEASGKFQLSPEWSISSSIRRASDRTFIQRYNINGDDRLRSNVVAERIGTRSFLSIAGWSFQTLRPRDVQGQVPIAIPVIDYRLRVRDPWVGGTLQLQANTLAITRPQGQDTQRAFVGAQWSMRRLTPLGQEVSLTAYARGDVYNSRDNLLTATVPYRGLPGWRTRGIAALAGDVRWPFIGSFLGGTVNVTPRVQLVVAPHIQNLAIPNEDARSVDLEDSNLFALNRFPGYDRFEDSSRVTYGVDYRYDRPYLAVTATLGQSYRINNRETIFFDGTGLSERLSDFVGRIDIRYRDVVTLTQRFRLDKDNFAVRRNEMEATVGSRQTYAKVSYLRLNRNVAPGIEDLRDIEEVRLAGRVAFSSRWSAFGSTAIDLTGVTDDPFTRLDGYTPLRHRIGVAYENDCISVEATWQREYFAFGDARGGNAYLLRLAFRNLGI